MLGRASAGAGALLFLTKNVRLMIFNNNNHWRCTIFSTFAR